MRIRPLVIFGDEKTLHRLRAEYRDYCGFVTRLTPTKLIVYPRKMT